MHKLGLTRTWRIPVIGVLIACSGVFCLLLKVALVQAQKDAIAPTTPSNTLDIVGCGLLTVGVAWFGVAMGLVIWSRSSQ